jgi:hypothetical protein
VLAPCVPHAGLGTLGLSAGTLTATTPPSGVRQRKSQLMRSPRHFELAIFYHLGLKKATGF